MHRETPRNHSKDTTADRETPADSNPVSLLCWNCGSVPARRDERLCLRCANADEVDAHWIPCTVHGWEHVRHRARRGQQNFTCSATTDPLPITP